MFNILSAHRGYMPLASSRPSAPTSPRIASSQYPAAARDAGNAGFKARFRALTAPIMTVGGIATLAALTLPLTATKAATTFEAEAPLQHNDSALAYACMKGAIFALMTPVGLLLAGLCLITAAAASLVCVPYALLASLPLGRAPYAERMTP